MNNIVIMLCLAFTNTAFAANVVYINFRGVILHPCNRCHSMRFRYIPKWRIKHSTDRKLEVPL